MVYFCVYFPFFVVHVVNTESELQKTLKKEEVCRHRYSKNAQQTAGIEPWTYGLRDMCSSAVLQALHCIIWTSSTDYMGIKIFKIFNFRFRKLYANQPT